MARSADTCGSCGATQPDLPVAASLADRETLPHRGYGEEFGSVQSTRIIAAILALILGTFGAHKFFLGFIGEGFVMLVVALIGIPCTGGASFLAMLVIGLIEGVIYLSKSDAEFRQVYLVNKKRWF